MNQSTSLAQLKENSAASNLGDADTSLGFFNGASFALTYRVGKMFAESTLVPEYYRGNVGNCMIALNMAHRLGADPLMVFQNLYVIKERPAWSAQFLMAMFNQSRRFAPIRFEFQGQEGKDEWGCRAISKDLASGEAIVGPLITIALARKNKWTDKTDSKWLTMPEQMLRYRAAAWMIKAYAPEIAMGLHTAEEMYDMRQNEAGVYEMDGPASITTATIKETIEAKAPEPKPEAVAPEKPAAPAPSKEEPCDGQSPPTMPERKPAKVQTIDELSGECFDLCKKAGRDMNEMLELMFPGVKKDKLTLENWQAFRDTLN